MIDRRHSTPYLIAVLLAAIILTACGSGGNLLAGSNPLAGRWREVTWIRCADGERVEPDTRIGEVDFMKNGEVRVTWHPFETYYDYRAQYEVDEDAGTLTLSKVQIINFLPSDVDGTGSFRVDESGNLILTDMWFGTWQTAPDEPVGCGHVLEFQGE